ncbi:MAG TPA: NifB/NifX family molybdenum-iron cluster-binding protein, partial [Methanocella sp.]|nr:NifB/NifX family molybdenum-iron cluster-binding protein [Methanocella sp.]
GITKIESLNNGAHDGEHNCAAPAIMLHKHGVSTVLVSGIGGRPLMSLNEQKIKVFAGAVGKVADAVQDFGDGLLRELSTRGTCNCSHDH